jgi:hypothetical protein
MMHFIKKYKKTIIGFFISLALLVFLFYKVDADFLERLANLKLE